MLFGSVAFFVKLFVGSAAIFAGIELARNLGAGIVEWAGQIEADHQEKQYKAIISR